MIKLGKDKLSDLVLSHKKLGNHPINDPAYARENLIALGETLVMLYFYWVIFLLALRLMSLNGLIESETLPWLLIEVNTNNLLSHLPKAMVESRFNIIVGILTTVVAARSVRRSFEILKAQEHPHQKGDKHGKQILPS